MSQLLFSLLPFGLLWAAGHIYVAARFGEPMTPRWRRVCWMLFGGHFVLTPTAMVVGRLDHMASLHVVAAWVGYLGAGAFVLLFVFTVLKDLGLVGVWAAGRATSKGKDPGPQNPERRRLMKLGINGGVVAATAMATRVGVHQARKIPDVKEVTVPIETLPQGLDGFRIVQLSDMHVGETIRRPRVEAIAERVDALDRDMIAITGDLAEGYVRHVWDDVRPVLELDAPHGTHYVTGNHEYYWNGRDWCEALDAAGLEVLVNDHVVLEEGGARLLVAGCTDYKAGQHIDDHASDPRKAIEGAPPHDVSVLLAHRPTSIEDAAGVGYDLQLSGHTHGGQFWPWNYIAGMVHDFPAGLGRRDDTWIYVSRGAGYWGPPVRLAAPSEITVITLRRGGREEASERWVDD